MQGHYFSKSTEVIEFGNALFHSLLISYTTDSNNPDDTWKGYVYAISMFLVALAMTLVIHQYWQIVFVLGMRIRTAIIGMVYAKVSFTNKTSNSNHRLKRVVDMPICVLKRGDLCDRTSPHENEARLLHQNELKKTKNKMVANLDLFCIHLHRQPNATQT